jgi:glycosyltransferase involved in cell wall biosynthesis
MNVLFLTSTLPRFAGDMQAGFVIEQASAWRSARPADTICVLAPHDLGAPLSEVVDGIRIERFRYFIPERWQKLAYPAILPNLRRHPVLWLQVLPFLMAEYRATRRLVRRLRPDVIYAHWVMPQGLVAWMLGRALGVPYILQNHSSDLSVFFKAGRMGRSLATSVLRGAAHFFCVNAAQRDLALGLFAGPERDEFANRCTVLPMGIAAVPVSEEPGNGRFDIATIARLSRKKGLHYLIQACEGLASRGVRPRIGIAGDGEDRSLLEGMVKRADIVFPGFLSGEAKDRFLSEAGRFAFPARAADGDVEGLPVALLEALARGVPVLASRDTNIEQLPEWPQIRDAVVFVEDPADVPALELALERLLAVDPRAVRYVSDVIGKYRWDRLIDEYIAAAMQALQPGTGEGITSLAK